MSITLTLTDDMARRIATKLRKDLRALTSAQRRGYRPEREPVIAAFRQVIAELAKAPTPTT